MVVGDKCSLEAKEVIMTAEMALVLLCLVMLAVFVCGFIIPVSIAESQFRRERLQKAYQKWKYQQEMSDIRVN